MSFDVYFQRFVDGEAVPGGGDAMRVVLEPHIVDEEPQHRFLRIEFGDGAADVYLDDHDMMANHISGDAPWDLLVEGARAAGWVILPVGCRTCITYETQRAHVPQHLSEDVALVMMGPDLQQVIRSS